MIEPTVDEMYRDDEGNQFLEVTYQNGDKEIMYFKDFSSGRHDREHRAPGQEAGRSSAHIADGRPAASGTDDLIDVHPPGVQGARGPAQHHQPRRLGEDLRQEGRAHRAERAARLVKEGGARPRAVRAIEQVATGAVPRAPRVSGQAPGGPARRSAVG